MFPTPTPLSVPERQTARGVLKLRYDDITQDGRFVLSAIPPLMAEVVWGRFLAMPENLALLHQGIVPILTRLLVTTFQGPFSPNNELEGSGGYQYAHSLDAAGSIDRLYVNMWTQGSAPHATTYAPSVPKDSPRAPAGAVYAEHVLTRLFNEVGNRKVTELSGADLPNVPETRIDLATPEALLTLPEHAVSLGDEVAGVPFTFGLFQTDSNRHVNSLVYPRLFEQAAVALFRQLGYREPLLATWADVRFRKPCFAGEKAEITLRAFESGGRMGVLGKLTTEGTSRGANCTAQLLFDGPSASTT